MDLGGVSSMLAPDMGGGGGVMRSTSLFLHSLSATAMRMNTYEFVSHISSDGVYYDEPEAGEDIRVLLASKYDAEKAEGLKRLLALMAAGIDASPFFSDVVKVVVTNSMPIKRMAYTFLAHYSSRRPDEALMVINTLHKALGDPHPAVRAHALRAMAAMRLRAAAPVVLLAVRRAARDAAPLVRCAAALTLPAVNDAAMTVGSAEARAAEEEVWELIDVLLADADASVVGCAAAVFLSECAWRLRALQPRVRALCHMLPELDEWGQAAALELLTRYGVARFGSVPSRSSLPTLSTTPDGLREDPEFALHQQQQRFDQSPMQSELQLLLRCSRMLLRSTSPAVVLCAAGLQWELNHDNAEIRQHAVPALLFTLRTSPHVQSVVLTALHTMAHHLPAAFQGVEVAEDLFLRPDDPRPVRSLKLSLISMLASDDNADAILQELQDYCHDVDVGLVVESAAAAAECAVRVGRVCAAVVHGLLHLVRTHSLAAADELKAELESGGGAGAEGEEAGKGAGLAGGVIGGAGLEREGPGQSAGNRGVPAEGGRVSVSAVEMPASSKGRRWHAKWLAAALSSPHQVVVGASMAAVKRVVELDPLAHSQEILELACAVECIFSAQGQAIAVWLLSLAFRHATLSSSASAGETSQAVSNLSCDPSFGQSQQQSPYQQRQRQQQVLREAAPLVLYRLARVFPDLHRTVKLQVLNAAVQIFLASRLHIHQGCADNLKTSLGAVASRSLDAQRAGTSENGGGMSCSNACSGGGSHGSNPWSEDTDDGADPCAAPAASRAASSLAKGTLSLSDVREGMTGDGVGLRDDDGDRRAQREDQEQQQQEQGQQQHLKEKQPPMRGARLAAAVLQSVLRSSTVDASADVRDRALFVLRLLVQEGAEVRHVVGEAEGDAPGGGFAGDGDDRMTGVRREDGGLGNGGDVAGDGRAGSLTARLDAGTAKGEVEVAVVQSWLVAAKYDTLGLCAAVFLGGSLAAENDAGNEGERQGQAGVRTAGGDVDVVASRSRFLLSSLSHLVNHRAPGYELLLQPEDGPCGEDESSRLEGGEGGGRTNEGDVDEEEDDEDDDEEEDGAETGDEEDEDSCDEDDEEDNDGERAREGSQAVPSSGVSTARSTGAVVGQPVEFSRVQLAGMGSRSAAGSSRQLAGRSTADDLGLGSGTDLESWLGS